MSGGHEVVGSNPAIPTNIIVETFLSGETGRYTALLMRRESVGVRVPPQEPETAYPASCLKG